MNILRKWINKSNWDYVANFNDGYALAVPNGRSTVYLINEDYQIVCESRFIICRQYIEESVKKAISNNCKYLAADAGNEFRETYYTFLDTQLKEVEGHKYSKILYYVPGKFAIVVEMDGAIKSLNGDLKEEELICSSETNSRYCVVNQEHFYITDEKTLKLVNIKTKEIKEFKGNYIEHIADGEFYRILQKDDYVYYDKNFNLMKDYESIGEKDKQGRIPIILKTGEIFIYRCNVIG